MKDSKHLDLSKIPTLRGQENYNEWSNSVSNVLKTLKAWPIIEGRYRKPFQPKYLYDPPVRPSDLNALRRQEYELSAPLNTPSNTEREEGEESSTTRQSYADLDEEAAKNEITYIKEEIEKYENWELANSKGVDVILMTISPQCKKEVQNVEEVKELWEHLKSRYVMPSVSTWNTELKALLSLQSVRKTGENPEKVNNKIMAIYTKAHANLEPTTPLRLADLCAFMMLSNSADDLSGTARDICNMQNWPDPQDITIMQRNEWNSKENMKQAYRPTATARQPQTPQIPQDGTQEASLNTMTVPNKRKGTWSSQRPAKRTFAKKCDKCQTEHARHGEDCWIAEPTKAPEGWLSRETNKERVKAFAEKQKK